MFEELREMNKEIRDKVERIAELRAMATSMTRPYDGDNVQTSPHDRLSDLMCKIITLENELDRMVDEYADIKAMITGEIFSLDNEEWQDILYSHYIEFESWGNIAKRKNLKRKTIINKKERALNKLFPYRNCNNGET